MIVALKCIEFAVGACVLLYGSMLATRELKKRSPFEWIAAGLTLFSASVLVVQQAMGFIGCSTPRRRLLACS
jgi:hypothetical protein